MSNYGHNGGEGRNTRTRGDHPAAGNVRLSAIPGSFIRQLKWMLPLFVVLGLLSFFLTRDIKRQYIADGRILVQLGPEYVYNPATGTNAASPLLITPDQVVQTEIGIIKNSAIIDQVINQMIASPQDGGVGGERFAPKLYEKWVKAPQSQKNDRWNDIVKMVEKSYIVSPKPKSSIVNLAYKHTDGEVAVKTLAALMAAYENFRKNKFIVDQSGQVAERRADTEDQLASIEAQIQKLLNRNGVSDFKTEQTGVQKRAEDLKTKLSTVRGKVVAAEASLAAAEDQLRKIKPTIDLYVDDRAAQRLAQAELEKRQLLAKYLPGSTPVRAKEAEIRELRAQIKANGGKPSGGRRVGPNPVYQALLTQRNTFQATADSLREQEIILQKQVNAAIAKVKRLRELGPKYENLMREKATVEARLKGLQARETRALVSLKQQDNPSENIKIITRPTTPRKGRNMGKILFALGLVGSAFTVFMLGLLRVFLDPEIYGPGPEARRGTEYTSNGYGTGIPEPIPYNVPQETEPAPYPSRAPAAAHMAGVHEAHPVSHYEQDIYSDEFAQPYQEPVSATGTYDTFAPSPVPIETIPTWTKSDQSGGSVSEDISQAQPYPTTNIQPASVPTQYGGPNADIPVLGRTTPDMT